MRRRVRLAFVAGLLAALTASVSVASAASLVHEAPPTDPAFRPGSQVQPVTGTEFPTSFVTQADPNCGVTSIGGVLQDANGRPIQGVAVRITSARNQVIPSTRTPQNPGGTTTGLSALSDANGRWNFIISPNSAVNGLWFVWVDRWGNRVSDSVNVLTNGPENCQPGGKGVQTVGITFRQGVNPPPPPRSPLPVRPPVAIDPTLRFPFGYVTDVNSNCQTTNISGLVLDARGNRLNGIRVRLEQANGQRRMEFMTVNGNWAFNLGPQAIAGQWRVYIDQNGSRESTVVDIQTDGPNRCNPGSGGVQLVEITFQRGN